MYTVKPTIGNTVVAVQGMPASTMHVYHITNYDRRMLPLVPIKPSVPTEDATADDGADSTQQ